MRLRPECRDEKRKKTRKRVKETQASVHWVHSEHRTKTSRAPLTGPVIILLEINKFTASASLNTYNREYKRVFGFRASQQASQRVNAGARARALLAFNVVVVETCLVQYCNAINTASIFCGDSIRARFSLVCVCASPARRSFHFVCSRILNLLLLLSQHFYPSSVFLRFLFFHRRRGRRRRRRFYAALSSVLGNECASNGYKNVYRFYARRLRGTHNIIMCNFYFAYATIQHTVPSMPRTIYLHPYVHA